MVSFTTFDSDKLVCFLERFDICLAFCMGSCFISYFFALAIKGVRFIFLMEDDSTMNEDDKRREVVGTIATQNMIEQPWVTRFYRMRGYRKASITCFGVLGV